MSEHAHRYQKLGGFLLLIVVLTFLGAFSAVINLFSPTGVLRALRGSGGGQYWLQMLILVCALYAIALQIMYAVMIIRRDPRFARIWQLIYIGTFVRAAAQYAMHLIYGFPEGGGSAYNTSFAIGRMSDIFAFLAIPVGLGLLTLYIKKSVRVRTYMGSDKYLRLAFFTGKAKGPGPAVPDEEG